MAYGTRRFNIYIYICTLFHMTIFTGKKTLKEEMTTYLLTYSTAQQPLKSFDRPLMRISLSNSILVILIFY